MHKYLDIFNIGSYFDQFRPSSGHLFQIIKTFNIKNYNPLYKKSSIKKVCTEMKDIGRKRRKKKTCSPSTMGLTKRQKKGL